MLVLGIETTTSVSSLALADEDTIIASLSLDNGLRHSATILPNIARLLKIAACDKKALTAIAVSIGPGSFTGLRIGLGTAKGLAYALGIPLLAVPTLAALANRFALPNITVAALADAQKKNAYCGFYRLARENDPSEKIFGRMREISPVKVLPIEAVIEDCRKMDTAVVIAGDIAAKCLYGRSDLSDNVAVASSQTVLPRADEVARLGVIGLKNGEAADKMTLEPWYLRRSQAEVLWDMRHLEKRE